MFVYSSSEHPPVLVADPVLGGGGGVALLAAGQLTVRGLAHALEIAWLDTPVDCSTATI